MLDLTYAEALLQEDRGLKVVESEDAVWFLGLREGIAWQFQLHRALQRPNPAMTGS